MTDCDSVLETLCCTGNTANATVAVTKDQVVQGDLELKIKSVLLCFDPSSTLEDTSDDCRTVYEVRA